MWYVLPEVRAELARQLVKDGFSQKKAAEKLGLTPAAVSQYLSKKRGEKARLSRNAKTKIRAAAKKIIESDGDAETSKIICSCCVLARGKTTVK